MTSRCPACNPMHGILAATPNRRKAAKHKVATCGLCKGAQMVEVDVAHKFLSVIRGCQHPQKTWSQWAVDGKDLARTWRDR